MSIDNNHDAMLLDQLLTYWGSMSRQQAIFFLEKFWQRRPGEKIINFLMNKHYICALHGDTHVVSCTDSPLETFTPEKEKCIWVFFRYLKMHIYGAKVLEILTKNATNGVDFTLGDNDPNNSENIINKKMYSICYVTSKDLTIRPMLIRTNRDDKLTYIFVCDSLEEAKKIVKINPDDKIWYVTDTQAVFYDSTKEEQ